MAYDLSNRLVVGIASSALFDLTESDAYFREHGEAAYREYQEQRLDEVLRPGAAFPFIQRLLGLNDLRPDDPLVEVIVLSRNDPDTGLRVMHSIKEHGLPISRAVFTQGKSPYEYIAAFEMSLFLSGERADVDKAIALGFPAGHVLPSQATYKDSDRSLTVAFDFDGVLADDTSERVNKEQGLPSFQEHEVERRLEAIGQGLLAPLLADLNEIQEIEDGKKAAVPTYEPRLRIAIVTARNAPAHERVIHSLTKWGVHVNDAFFLGGVDKSKVLGVMRPHIFFDDQTSHLSGAATVTSGVHIPYGVANPVERVTVLTSDDTADTASLISGASA